MHISQFARISAPDSRTEVLEYGETRADMVLLGHRITIRRVGTAGITSGPCQARYYVCDETAKIVVAGPFCRKRHATACVGVLFSRMETTLPLLPVLSEP